MDRATRSLICFAPAFLTALKWKDWQAWCTPITQHAGRPGWGTTSSSPPWEAEHFQKSLSQNLERKGSVLGMWLLVKVMGLIPST